MIRICPERDAQCPNGMACAEPCAGSSPKSLTPREKVECALYSMEDWRLASPEYLIENILTALASGSGDHAKLARLAEKVSEFDIGWYELQDSVVAPGGGIAPVLVAKVPDEIRRAFIAAANPATVLALLAENAALRGERDWVAKELRHQANCAAEQSVNATEAERKLAEAVGLLRGLADYTEKLGENLERNDLDMHLDACDRPQSAVQSARTFLSKEAERG